MHELQIFSPLPLSPATAEPFWGFNIRLDPTGAPAASHGPGRTATRVQAKMRKRMESVVVSYFGTSSRVSTPPLCFLISFATELFLSP